MESKAKLFGHPVHQMLIVFPLGLLVTSVIMDVIHLVTGERIFAIVAFYNIVAGVIGGVLAAIFGFRDFVAIPTDTRAKRIGFWHGTGNVVLLILFSFSMLIRWNATDHVPGVLGLLASFAGLAIGTVTAWMGGELVDRLGVGVDPGANLNAPSSLMTEHTAPVRAETLPVTGQERVLNDPVEKPTDRRDT